MIDVLYDISILSAARASGSARTGVARVAENVLFGLMQSPGVRVSLCSAALPYLHAESAQYVGANSVVSGARLFEPPVLKSAAYRRLIPDAQSIGAGGGRARRWKAVARRALEATRGIVPAEALAGRGIFHSPFFRFPYDVRRAPRVKRFLMVHDLIAILQPQLAPGGAVMRRIMGSLGREDWAICNSNATRNDLIAYRKDLNPDHMPVIYLAAGEQFRRCPDAGLQRQVRERYGIPPESPFLLALNTLEGRKNMASVIRAFGRVISQEHGADLHLVLAGGKGWKFDELEAEMERSAEARGRVVLAGYIKDDDLAALYSSAIAFVYPSLYEGFGLPTLEAMQCGTPVITSNTSSLPEVVGDAAITVTPTDLDAICQAMVTLCRSESLRREYSARGLAQAKRFSWERCARETVAAYTRALAE